MELVQLFFTAFVIVGAIATLGFLNKKFNLGLNDGHDCDLWPQQDKQSAKQLQQKDEELQQLTQRIQHLERIVTDPQEQLKREIDNLR